MEYDLAKINDEYYIYAFLGSKSPENYSVALKDVNYLEGSEAVRGDIIKNFTITNETADFSINPGFIITDKDFSIQVQNLKDYEINITIGENKSVESSGFFASFSKSIEGGKTVSVKSGEIKNIEFELGNKTSFRKIWLSTENLEYELPVYEFVSQVQEEPGTEEEQNASAGEEANETAQKPVKTATTKKCAEVNGTICKTDEKCSETPIPANDAMCCLKTCKKIEKSSTGKIIGWGILAILLIVVIWFAKRTSRAKKKEKLLIEIAKKIK